MLLVHYDGRFHTLAVSPAHFIKLSSKPLSPINSIDDKRDRRSDDPSRAVAAQNSR